AGMLGERKPDLSAFEPSWHHTYAMLAWHEPLQARRDPLHYPPIHAARVRLTTALYRLANDPAERAQFAADRKSYVARLELEPAEEKALAALDQGELLGLGIHPLVYFLANMQIEHDRRIERET
ncbi:MAG: hypothetical protein ACREFQ_05935, partial [Stellaceae bacterium]